MRLRRRQKWVFAALAVLFAFSFAALGVGSGSGGLEHLFNNINLFGGSSGPSVSKAQKEVAKNPNSAKAYRDLATAYETKADTANAIVALQQYTNIRRKDAKAWTELAGLQSAQAQTYLADYQNAYAGLQLAAPSQSFAPPGKLGTGLGTNPIESAQQSTIQSSVSDLQQKVQVAYNGAVSSWQRVTDLQPKNADAWFQLAQSAQTSGDTKTAVKAYKTYLKLNPDSTSASQIKALIKSLGG